MDEQVRPAAAETEVNAEILVRRKHRRRQRQENRVQRIWRRRRWEILGGLALVIGLFLAFGPLARWTPPSSPAGEPVDLLALYFDRIMNAIASRMDRAAELVWTFMLLTNWAIKLGYVLLAFAIILIPLRARRWLLHESPWLEMCCPRCGSTQIHRVHRRSWERIAARIVPVRRYRCSNCRWQGTRIESAGHGPSATVAPSRN